MLKDKLRYIVNPRFFWSSITILVFLCAWLFTIAEDQRILNISLEAKLTASIAENKILESNLVNANKEIAARDEQMKLTLDKLEVAINEKEAVIKEKEALEGKINEMTAQSSDVDLQKIIVKTPPQ
ncbi:MAG: hypothetical protein ABIH27_02170 [Candidatus Omnitrophota bacterium]